MNTSTPREEFEEWLETFYENSNILSPRSLAWEAWQASQKELTAAREESDKWEQLAHDKLSEVCRQIEKTRAVTEQRDRLDDQMDHILLRLGRTQERMIDAERQRDRLEAEIRLTIMENVHLADGDLCTLKRLKDAIGFEFNESLQPLKTTKP